MINRLIVGYVTPARPPTARSLVVGKSKCAFQASARSQRVLNNIFFVTEITTQCKISYKYYQQLPCINYKSLNFTEITNLSPVMNPSQNLALNLFSSANLAATQDLTPDQVIPNQINNIPTRIREAKEFLQKNPKEHLITVARIYNLSESTLRSSISRSRTMKHGGHNQILEEYQKQALHLFIQLLLACQIQPTY